MNTILYIAGAPVAVPADVILGKLTAFAKGSFPTLSFFSRAGALPGNPDPYLGRAVALTINGTRYFSGDVTHGPDAQYDDRYGWVLGYQCMGIRNRMDWIPHTDSNTGTDTSGFNLQPEDPGYIAGRAGRTVGQVLATCLTMAANATALDALGIGNYTTLAPPTLPAATVADLAALAIVPPAPCYFQGGKLGGAVEGFLAGWAWNHWFHVQPDGTMRFLDQRSFTDHTFTLESDPIEPTPLARGVSENFQRVVVRGAPLNLGLMLTTLSGGLVETFAHDGLTNAQAKAAWRPADFQQPTLPSGQATATANLSGGAVASATLTSGGYNYSSTPGVVVSGDGSGAVYTATMSADVVTGLTKVAGGSGYTHATLVIAAPGGPNTDSGACSCPSTTQVTVTSASTATNWPANYWDQTASGRKAVAYLQYALGTGITQHFAARVVSNTALSPGGTSTLTLDATLPITSYDSYVLIGTSGGASNVWRLYTIANAAIGAALTTQFAYPQPFRLASGNAVTLSSAPMGSVVSAAGVEATLSFTSDPAGGTILFAQPTFTVAGGAIPGDVRALVAVNVGVNQAVYPPDVLGIPQYLGTSHTIEGLAKTLTLTIDAWRDPANQASMNAYASDVLDSVKDTVVEGTISYLGLYEPALTLGTAASVTGSTFTTGWEGLSLPVIECELQWPQGDGVNWITTLHCSNRRAQLSTAAFLRPDRLGLSIAGGQAYNPFGVQGGQWRGTGGGTALPPTEPGGPSE